MSKKLQDKVNLIVICGPTASGKTELSLRLAEIFDGEIIGADSMQIYRGMDIVTAMPTKPERERVRHRLIDFLEPSESFSVADYVKLAKEAISEVVSNGKMPILCGGTGLYINSLIDGISLDETRENQQFREKMLLLAKEYGNEFLHKKLEKVDPKRAKELHPNNVKRVIRALEIYEFSGRSMTESNILSRNTPSIYNSCIIGLDFENRQDLYDRINKRVDIMFEQGLLQEAKKFFAMNNTTTSAQAIGYKELFPYIKGEQPLEECVEKLKQRTRNYAKRQLTWFRRDERVNWYKIKKNEPFQNIVNFSEKTIAFYFKT
ncbi:MAG: tRNA (adenosine(37)-N6)-dimethylallyltransferase MiaA [Clostridiales bacterium]|nr:tRNA (adenosine(37)-N6)-dimethylallyltransferase MiaA [Clostridiales bacterium]